ncbi:MAG TPA: ABC transporter permease [Candidatus Deferrimicrobium sp.]|nr:ABC transporter permease [Candidatus Deferrimicrobium sp.]
MIIIEAGKPNRRLLTDLWNYRELFVFLSWRDILVRYKQTAIGMLWGVIRPLLTMMVFTLVFGKIAKLPSEGIPYPILVFTAMLPWQLFATSFSESSNSLIGNVNLIAKIYFPRLIIPVSSIIVNVVDFFISFVLLSILMLFYNNLPDWRIIVLPVLLLFVFLLALGLGLWFSALNVKYRDFRYVIPFVVQFGLYVSPVGFSSTVVPAQWRFLYSLNPLVGIIDGFRWSLLRGQTDIYLPGLLISIILVLSILVTGFLYFRKTEITFADVI